jgi:hypothetical protein
MTFTQLTTSSWSGFGTSKASNAPAADAETNDQPDFVRLDVNVGRPTFDGFEEDEIHGIAGCHWLRQCFSQPQACTPPQHRHSKPDPGPTISYLQMKQRPETVPMSVVAFEDQQRVGAYNQGVSRAQQADEE